MYGATAVDGLDQEAIETARAWLRLEEPHRSALRDMIMQIARDAERRTEEVEAAETVALHEEPVKPSWRQAS